MTENSINKVNVKTAVPKYGLKLKLNHVYPDVRKQGYVPKLKQLWVLLPLILRYIFYYIKAKLTKKSVVMDYLHTKQAQPIYGVPLGGIGSGTIGRGFRGEFTRFQLRPGLYEWNTVDADQFIVTIKDAHQQTIFHSLLSTYPKSRKSLSSWESFVDASKCTFTGLYPRSWTEYDFSEYGIKLVCRQISPVIPNNYKDTSLPCGVFVWDIENVGTEERTVTVAFTFKNGIGNKNIDKNSTCSSKAFSYLQSEGVILYHTIDKMQCTYALSSKTNEKVSVSKCLYFNPNSDGLTPWLQLKNDGRFEKCSDKHYGHIFGEMGVGIASKTTVQPSQTNCLEISLIWDMPCITFPKKNKKYSKYYTKYFGVNDAVLKMMDYAFNNYKLWEEAIDNWQSPVLNQTDLPDWYKGALFNETYFVSDGGSLWVVTDKEDASKLKANDPRIENGKFFYLEGHEYKMCNTYDVHFYASYALKMNWPKLQEIIQYDMRDAIFLEIPTKVKMLYDGQIVERKVPNTVPHDLGDPVNLLSSAIFSPTSIKPRPEVGANITDDNNCLKEIIQYDMRDAIFLDIPTKVKMLYVGQIVERKVPNTVPHDLGDPGEEPFILVNSYPIHDVSEWRDLNPKFVLQVFRDASISPSEFNPNYLSDMYDACYIIMKHAQKFDIDNDGVIENSGFPDQTFDTWVMTGTSAYCGGLWLAAVFAMTVISEKLGKLKEKEEFEALFEKGVKSYERKLWNGDFYNYDCSDTQFQSVMADQLCGQWYLRNCGYDYKIIPQGHVRKTLETIYENNVLSFCDGTMGAVNGYIKGVVDDVTIQSEEVWTGVTYALASIMIQEGMLEEAFKTAGGMYDTLANKCGLAFNTPEALYATKYYRAIGYMRPLSIWSMQLALEQRKIK